MKGNGKLEEKDLIIPVLELMRHNKGVISIGEIKDFMLKEYPLSNIDKTISKTRPNEYIFEQQIRNLTSHKKLEKMGLAENTDGGFKLLPEISDLLKNSSEWLYALISDDKINNQLLKKTISTIDKTKSIIGYHELTNEGELLNRNISLRLRSQKLRNIALSHFSINGTIKCRCCNFDFSIFYGNNYGIYWRRRTKNYKRCTIQFTSRLS